MTVCFAITQSPPPQPVPDPRASNKRHLRIITVYLFFKTRPFHPLVVVAYSKRVSAQFINSYRRIAAVDRPTVDIRVWRAFILSSRTPARFTRSRFIILFHRIILAKIVTKLYYYGDFLLRHNSRPCLFTYVTCRVHENRPRLEIEPGATVASVAGRQRPSVG